MSKESPNAEGLPLQKLSSNLLPKKPEPDGRLIIQRAGEKGRATASSAKPKKTKTTRHKNVLMDAHGNLNASTPGGTDTSTGRAISKPAKDDTPNGAPSSPKDDPDHQ